MIRELLQRIANDATAERVPWLLIGGLAMTRLGHARMTLDVDLLVKTADLPIWEKILTRYHYQRDADSTAFAQYSGRIGWPRVDLMLVDDETFQKLAADSTNQGAVATPSPRHMVALKLHAAMSATRSRPEMDWDDIRHLVKLHHLNPGESEFRAMILRHGGEKALAKIEDIWHYPG